MNGYPCEYKEILFERKIIFEIPVYTRHWINDCSLLFAAERRDSSNAALTTFDARLLAVERQLDHHPRRSDGLRK